MVAHGFRGSVQGRLLHFLGPEVKQNIKAAGVCGRGDCLPHSSQKTDKGGGAGDQCALQRHAPSDLLLQLGPPPEGPFSCERSGRRALTIQTLLQSPPLSVTALGTEPSTREPWGTFQIHVTVVAGFGRLGSGHSAGSAAVQRDSCGQGLERDGEGSQEVH